MNQIICNEISFRYPSSDKIVLEKISLKFSSGEIIGLVGLNGSGKTTLLKILAGILPVTQGKIYYDDLSIKNIKDTKNTVIYVPENAKLFLIGPTVFDEFYRFLKSKDLVLSLLGKFKLDSIINKKIYELSEGQRRLIAILSALHQQKNIFFLDEPTIGLDSDGRDILLHTITKVKNNNGIVIIATNDTRILPYLDRIVCLKDGNIPMDDKPQDVLIKLEEDIGIIPNQISRIVSNLKKRKYKIPQITLVNEFNDFLNSLEE